MDLFLETERLRLRPFVMADAPALQAGCGNWNVARTTGRIPHPYPDGLAETWIASHGRLGESGEEHPFCVTLDGGLIGTSGLHRNGSGSHELGYWIGEPWWGQGFASEAARRLIAFAFAELGAARLTSCHFRENSASGRVLEKCGFRYTGEDSQWCEARGCSVACRRFLLRRSEAV